MQALSLTKAGHASENFHVVNDFPKPGAPGKGDLLVKVSVAALNPVDYKQAQYGFLISSYPVVLGCTCAGLKARFKDVILRKENFLCPFCSNFHL